jgi:hypothetical protein
VIEIYPESIYPDGPNPGVIVIDGSLQPYGTFQA